MTQASTPAVTSAPYRLFAVDICCQQGPWTEGRGIIFATRSNGAAGLSPYVYQTGLSQGSLVQGLYLPLTWLDGFSEFSLARSAGSDNSVMAVGKRTNLAGQHIFVQRIDTTAFLTLGVPPPQTLIYSASGGAFLGSPDVDGRDGHWVATWRRNAGLSGSSDTVLATSIEQGTTADEFVHGPIVTIAAGTPTSSSTAPTVGWSPAKTWIGYRRHTSTPLHTTSVRATGIDSGSCVACNDSFAVTVLGGNTARMVVTTAASSGAVTSDDALAVWSANGDVFAQRLVNHGSGGLIAHLGGGCGNGGSQSFNHTPAIGGSSLLCTISGLPAAAFASMFNVSPVVTPVTCGSCTWLPYATTTPMLVVGGSASAPLPIPCQLALVGSMLETQWTTVVLGMAPCSLMPDVVFSGRARLTIGQ